MVTKRTAKKTTVKRRKVKTESVAPKPSPIKKKLTKGAIITALVQAADEVQDRQGYLITEKLSSADTRRLVTGIFNAMCSLMVRSVMPRSIGVFVIPGFFKLYVKDRPAIRKGTLVRNPGTGEMQPSKGRPASKRPKALLQKKLKDAVNGEFA